MPEKHCFTCGGPVTEDEYGFKRSTARDAMLANQDLKYRLRRLAEAAKKHLEQDEADTEELRKLVAGLDLSKQA